MVDDDCAHGVRLQWLCMPLIALVILSDPACHAYAGGELSGSAPQPPPGPYCGLYSLYTASRVIDKSVRFEKLLDPKYLSSPQGSSAAELIEAARDIGLTAKAIEGLAPSSLCNLDKPAILHVRGNARSRAFDHWVLYLGMQDGKLAIFEAPQGVRLYSTAELQARWDGFGIIVSDLQWSERTWIWSSRWEILSYLGCAFAIAISIRSAQWPALMPSRFNSFIISRQYRLVSGICILLLLSIVIGYVFHWIAGNGFLTNNRPVAMTWEPFVSAQVPKLDKHKMQAAVDDLATIIIDARFPMDYDAGHIPRALNVPINTGFNIDPLITGIPKNRRVIVYCQSIGCHYDEEVASTLVAHGYTRVEVYPGGWNEWSTSE